MKGLGNYNVIARSEDSGTSSRDYSYLPGRRSSDSHTMLSLKFCAPPWQFSGGTLAASEWRLLLCSACLLWPLCQPQVCRPVHCRRTGGNFNADWRVIPSVKHHDRGLKALVKRKPVWIHGNGPHWGPANGKDHLFSNGHPIRVQVC